MSSGKEDRENDREFNPVSERMETGRDIGVPPGEIVIGTVTGIDGQGRPVVSFSVFGEVIASASATTTVSVKRQDIGRQAAIVFIESDIGKPVVIGLVHSQLDMLLEAYGSVEAGHVEMKQEQADRFSNHPENSPELKEDVSMALEDVIVDGKKIHIEGQEEIVFRCGESSITMTRAGKITIRGKYILNRSSGVNRILGGSVQVN